MDELFKNGKGNNKSWIEGQARRMNEYVDEETVLQFQVSNSAEMPFQGSAISSDNEAIKCFEGHSPNRGV